MRKFLFFTSALVMLALTAMAVPAKRGQQKMLTLANGTEVKATLVGDEHGHYWLADDGAAYVDVDGIYQQVDAQQIAEKAKVRRQTVNSKRVKRLQASRRVGEVGSYTGKKRAIIILVNFKNVTFESTNAYFNRIANEENFKDGSFKGSMADYFKAQSRGKFELDFDVVGPVTVSENASYYGKNDSEGNDLYPGKMVIEAVKLAKDSVSNWKQYDWDNDGYVDQVYVVYAGQGEADGGAASTIWPHAYTLSSAKAYGDGTGPVTVATGLKVDTYACGSELDGYGNVGGIGTMCHEFSHCLGYPDCYDIDYSGGWGMDIWDLMCSGSYNGDGYLPAGYTSYERWEAGWEEPTVLEDEDVNVSSLPSLQSSGQSYIIYNKKNRDEYYMLENRQQDGWDAGLPGAGLLIVHVDYNESVWANNQPNDDPNHQRMTWVQADNKLQTTRYMGEEYLTLEGLETDLFPYNSNNSFNRSTKPAAKLFNNNVDGTKYLTSSVEDITRNADGSIAFKFVAQYNSSVTPDPDPDDPDQPSVEGAVFYESFSECAGKGGNDDEWGSSVASAKFQPDNDGWVATASYGGYQCARFGSSKKSGVAKSPRIPLNSNEHTLTFKAAAWGTDSKTLSLSTEGSTVVIEPKSFTMGAGEWTTFTAKIKGTGTVSLVFTPGKRFFLDEVAVIDDVVATSITTVDSSARRSNAIYTLDGRFVGTDASTLRHGLYIINGKKVVK